MTLEQQLDECHSIFERLTAENAALRADLAKLAELTRRIREYGRCLAVNTGGTFENDPIDAILDAMWRSAAQAQDELAVRMDTKPPVPPTS